MLGRIRPRHDGTQVSALCLKSECLLGSATILFYYNELAFTRAVPWHCCWLRTEFVGIVAADKALCPLTEIVGIMSAGKALCPSC